MLKIFVNLTNGALELRGWAPGMFCAAQIRRRPEDVLTAMRWI